MYFFRSCGCGGEIAIGGKKLLKYAKFYISNIKNYNFHGSLLIQRSLSQETCAL